MEWKNIGVGTSAAVLDTVSPISLVAFTPLLSRRASFSHRRHAVKFEGTPCLDGASERPDLGVR
jgi:hypothetical protein